MRILILGGTSEARHLAGRLVGMGHEVITSLAGRTQDPILPAGGLRVGKFGGVSGLAAYLEAAEIERVVDATHPYAQLMSTNAVAAAQRTGVPLVRMIRPAWPEPDGAGWRHVETVEAAAAALPPGATALITTGHEGLEAFLARDDCRLVVRLIGRPALELPPNVRLILMRPPYELEDELALFEREEISDLVTKNSGGAQTEAKLEAAARRNAGVIMIDRPILPPATETHTIAETIAALHLGNS